MKLVARCLQKVANGKAYKEPEEVIKKYFNLSTSIKQENFIMVLGSLVPRNRKNAKFIQAKVLPTLERQLDVLLLTHGEETLYSMYVWNAHERTSQFAKNEETTICIFGT